MAYELSSTRWLWLQVYGLGGQEVTVEAVGPRTVAFSPVAGTQWRHTGVLTVAGSYLLHVRLAGVSVAGWPRLLHVLAGQSDASRWGNQ